MKKNINELAFPAQFNDAAGYHEGCTKHEYAAIQILSGMLANGYAPISKKEEMADLAYEIAAILLSKF